MQLYDCNPFLNNFSSLEEILKWDKQDNLKI